jgi:hypothetical protein
VKRHRQRESELVASETEGAASVVLKSLLTLSLKHASTLLRQGQSNDLHYINYGLSEWQKNTAPLALWQRH